MRRRPETPCVVLTCGLPRPRPRLPGPGSAESRPTPPGMAPLLVESPPARRMRRSRARCRRCSRTAAIPGCAGRISPTWRPPCAISTGRRRTGSSGSPESARAGDGRGGERARARGGARPRSRGLRRGADRGGMGSASRSPEPPSGGRARALRPRGERLRPARDRGRPSRPRRPAHAGLGIRRRPPRRSTGPALLRTPAAARASPRCWTASSPSYPHYVRNRRELAHYRRLARAGEPAAGAGLGEGPDKVEPGQPWAGVPALRATGCASSATSATDGAPAAADGTPLYDAALVAAVKRFQARHILDADGVIGAATIEAINVPLARARAPARAGDGARPLASPARRAPDHLRERPALPPLGLRSRPRRRAAAHERRGRQVGEPPHADLRGGDGVRRLPPLLESPASAS